VDIWKESVNFEEIGARMTMSRAFSLSLHGTPLTQAHSGSGSRLERPVHTSDVAFFATIVRGQKRT
jgi:hypothetical protein